jgi:hypothetical protein
MRAAVVIPRLGDPPRRIHPHSTSMFIPNTSLEIAWLTCPEINHHAIGPPLAELGPHFREVQQATRSPHPRDAHAGRG